MWCLLHLNLVIKLNVPYLMLFTMLIYKVGEIRVEDTTFIRNCTYMYQLLIIIVWKTFNIGFLLPQRVTLKRTSKGSSLISRRLHYRGLQSLFLTKCKELWLCANGRFRMRSGMRKELWLCANGNILGCAVIWCKELWLCANGWFRMRSEPCAFLSRFSLFAYILQILTRVSKGL